MEMYIKAVYRTVPECPICFDCGKKIRPNNNSLRCPSLHFKFADLCKSICVFKFMQMMRYRKRKLTMKPYRVENPKMEDILM